MNRLSVAFIALSALGIVIAVILTYEYLTADFTVCNINSFFSCGAVASSPYSRFFGIPMYVFGLVWFPLLFALSLAFSSLGRKETNVFVLLPLLLLGDIFTVYLWYDQLVLIGKLCPFCISLYFVNYALTGLALVILKH
ncbi:MAG: vitamin K epoxide reductase family protein [Conexivisphaerales archaeon]